MEYKLNDNLCLKYIECVKIDAVNYYKYVVNNLKAKSSDSKEIYFNRQIDLKNIDKDKLSNYITKNILLADENLVVNLDDFMLNKPTKEKEKSGGSSSDGGNASRKSNKNNTGSMGFELLNLNKFDEAHNLINGANECGNIMMALINLSGHESLNGQNSGIADSITGFKSKIKGLAGGNGPTAFFCEYKSVYNDLRDGINIAVATQMLLLEENGYLKQSEESLAMFGNEAFSKEFRELMNGVVNGEITFNNTAELNDAIASLQSKYSVVTEDDAKMILGAASLTEDSEKLKNMSPEEREKFIKNKNEQLDSIYNHLNETIGITRDAFDNMLKNNLDELAKMISDASIKSAENVKAGGEGINIMNDLIYSIQDSWYSTSAGQEALLDRFKDESITGFDEYDALANTEYIKYCIMTGHTQDWLKDDFRKFANVVAKLDATGNFSTVTDNLSEEELDYVNSYVDATGFIPYGYVKVKKDGKDVYKRRDYTKQGQEMLYYMDYHCGEDVAKEDDKKIITAFSERGKFDAYERNYKGGWINDRITGNYSNESEKQKAIENAERDYNILNGIIDDPDRKQELIDEGCISFEQLSSFINNDSVDLSQLANKDYIDENKEEIMAATGLSESQLYNFTITGSLPPTGSVYIDSKIQANVVAGATLYISTIQGLTGVAKFFENVGDAAKTAVNNDFFLNIGTTKDPIYGTTHYNGFSQNIEFAKEFKEYRENIWSKYLSDNDRYKKDFDEFSKEISDDQLKQFIAGILGPTVSQYSLITSDSYSLSDADRQKYLPKMFEEIKMQEWSLNDSSSSNYYLATFKEGIRNGGDFSSFNNLDTYIVDNATKQFEVINEVADDKVGKFMQENVYDKDWYNTVESFSVVKHDNILGMAANQLGNMIIPVGLSLIPGVGQVLSSGALFTSAFGGAAEEAFISGASYNEALGYATLSAGTEILIEKVFSGIQGYGQGWLDNLIETPFNKAISGVDNVISSVSGKTGTLAGKSLTQKVKKLITGGIGEAVEEVATDFITPLYQSLTYMSEKSDTEIRKESFTLENEIQTALVSFLSSMVFGSGEIRQKTNQFNKQMQNIPEEIRKLPEFQKQADKVLADIIGYDGEYLTSEIITKIIEDNAREISQNLESASALKEIQQKLSDAYQTMTENTIELKTEDGSVKLSKELIINISDITGLNHTSFFKKNPDVTIDGNQVIFKDTAAQNKFIRALYSNASKVLNNQSAQNNEAIKQYEKAIEMNNNGELNLEDLSSAIQVLKELGDRNHLSEALGSVILDVNGQDITIPKSAVHEITSKYNIENGKIVFTEENMNPNEFVSNVLSLAKGKLISKNLEAELKVLNFNAASMSQSVELLEEAANIIGNILNTYIVNSTKVDGKDLIKLEVQNNVDGVYKTINIYVDSSTSPIVYMHNELLNQKIQEIIKRNPNKENIYMGEMVYDKKNDKIIINQNLDNKNFVENNKQLMDEINLTVYEFQFDNGTNSKSVNIYLDQEMDMTILENNNVKKNLNEVIAEKLKVNPNSKDIYIGKIELRNGQSYVVNGENHWVQKAYVDSKTENIVTTERSNVNGTDLIKVETYVTIDGKTEKVNTYLDSNSNTSLLSDKNAKDKILEIIIEEKKNNSEVSDVYVGEILKDKKSGNIVVRENNTTLGQFRSVIIASAALSGTTTTSTIKTVTTTNTTSETNNVTNTNTEVVTEDIVIDTKNIVTASMVKPKIDKFIEDIEKTIKEFVSKHKNDEDFNIKLEQLKVDTDIKLNEIIVKVTEEVNQSYNEVLEQINKKLDSLKDNDSQIDVLKEQIDTLTKKRVEEIRKIREIDTSKIDEIFNSINTSSDVNTNDLSLNFLSINEIIKKSTEQMDLFIEKLKNECQRFNEISHKTKENIENFIKEQRNKYEVKLEETKKSLRESYEKKLKEINEKIENAKENSVLKDKLINAKNELISKYKEQVQNLIKKSNTQFESIINNLKTKHNNLSINNIETSINDLTSNVRKTIRNSFNNLNPNNSVNRFASKINSLTQIISDVNIKEILDKYIKTLETSNDSKVREEFIKDLESKLTNKQIESLTQTLEEIGSFINHYGINGENLSKLYNAITWEEKPSRVIRKEVNKERIAKLKDKKALVKNIAIGAIVSYTTDPTALLVYDQMYKYVEIRKQTGTITDKTLLGKMLDSKLGKFIDAKIESMKTIKVTEKNNTLENNVKLPKKVAGVKPGILEKYLNDKNLLLELSKQEPTPDKAKLIFALKTTEIMQKNIGIELDKETIKIINQLYNDNINDIARYSMSNKLSKVYYKFEDLTKQTRKVKSAIKELEKQGYKPKQIADALLSTSIVSPNSNSARVLYDKAFDYLVEKGYSKEDAANVVGSIYSDLIDKKGFETITVKEGYKIHIQKGINWNNQAYTIDYIQNEIFKLKNAYKTDFPIDIYVYDTFNPYDKYWEIEYKSKDFKSAATGGNNTINIYDNKVISETTLKHEFGHLVDWQIMKDSKQKGRFANSEEWLNAIEKDGHAPTGYAKTNSVEDFAESVAHFLKDPKKFKRQFKNRYNVLVKYIDVNAYQNANIESQILTTTTSINNVITEVIDEIKLTKHNHVKNIQTVIPQDIDSLNIESNNDVILEDISDKKVSIPTSFEVDSIDIFSGKQTTISMDTSLLEKLTKDSAEFINKLTGIFDARISPKTIKDGVIKYIDFAKENSVSIEIDVNVQKWYDAVKLAKENNHILTNENDIIRNGVSPETKSIFDDYIQYNRYGANIKLSELLEMIEAKRNITLTPAQFTTALNELSNYIKRNGIKLNENVTNILNKITNIEQNQVVINPIEVINGKEPIILNKYIKVDGRNVSTLQLIELISNKNNLVGLISNNVYIDGLQYVNIEQAVIDLFNISPELSIQYNDILDLIKDAKNSYVLFDVRNNTYAILPKEINGVKAETIFESTETINRIINSEDVETVNKYISAIDSIINIINEKNIQIDVSYLIDIRSELKVPEIKSRNVFGVLHKAYSLNQEIGGTYGPEQSAVGIKLSKIQLKSSIETLFKTKMTDIEFFNHLGLDSVTQEKFKKILDKNYKRQNGIFAKIFGDYANTEVIYQEIQKLANIVKNNIPGLNDKQAFMFLYYMEAGEIGANGICSYADAASIIINEYLEKPIEFEQDFGFPMYIVNKAGNRIYNYEMLIVDMYSSINKDKLLTIDNKTGSVTFNSTNQNQTYLSNFNGGLNKKVLNKYFKEKNIELSVEQTFYFNSKNNIMRYEKLLEIIAKELQKGNTVHLGASGFALYDEQGQNVADDVGEHAMTVLGINSDGNLVVNSWGKIAIFDLKAELAKAGLEYSKTDANGEIIKKGISTLDIEIIETKDGISEFEGVIELTKNSNRSSVQSSIGLKVDKDMHTFMDSIGEKAASRSENIQENQFKDLVQYIENNRNKEKNNDFVFINKVKEIYKNLLNSRPDSLYGLHSILSKNIGSENASNLMNQIGRELLINDEDRHKVNMSDISLNKESISQYFKDMFKYMKDNGLIGNSQYKSAIRQVDTYSIYSDFFEKTISRVSIESDFKLDDLQSKQLKNSMTRLLMYMQILDTNIDIGEIRFIIRNSETPARFNEKYNSNYSITKSETGYDIELWNSNVSEENLIRAFANIIVSKISTIESFDFTSKWVKAVEHDNQISSYSNLISITHDFIESFTLFNKNPKQYFGSFSGNETKGSIIKELFVKSSDSNVTKFVDAILKQNGTDILLYKPEKIDVLTQFRYEANNYNSYVQEIFNNYSYEDYHLIYGGITLNKDGLMYGTHSIKNFVTTVINNGIQVSNYAVHPSFREAVFEYYIRDYSGNTNPKTIFSFSTNKILKMYHYTIEKYRKAISNNILSNIGDSQLILLPNGLWIQRYGDINGESRSFYPIINNVAGGYGQFVYSDKTNLPIPIKINGETKIINVSVDGEITKEILEYGSKLIQTVRRVVNNNESISLININELRFNQATETFDIVVKNDSVEVVIPNSLVMNKEIAPYVLEYIEAFKDGKILRDESVTVAEEDIKKYSKGIDYLDKTYSSIPTTTLLDFVKLDVDGIAKVLINKEQFNGYDADTMLDAITEVYNYSKENNINISINPNLEHFIKEYQKVNLDENNILMNMEDALYNRENIISVPERIRVESYRRVDVIDLFNIINGRKNISETRYSEVDIYEATKEIVKYFEDKNVTMSALTKNAFDIVKNIDENSVVINFIDALNGKEKIVLPKTIEGKYGDSKISDVIEYLNGEPRYISTGVIETLKEYIDTNNIYIPSDMMDKINLLSSIGEDNVLLNEEAYLKGESSPIIVPKNLEGIYTKTSTIYGWITGEEKLYNMRTIEEVIKLTTKFTEYVYSNSIVLDSTTMSKLEVLKNLKEDETIINLEEFFNGSSAIIVKNNINVNGTNIKLSTVLDAINLIDNTHLKVLSGRNIDGLTRENIFDAIGELYKVRSELRLTTISNYSKIKNIYDNNYIFNERYLFPKTFNNITCELIEEILNSPIKIAKYNSDERTQIIDAINEYIELVGSEAGKYYEYNKRVKMRDNLISLMTREIPQTDLLKEVYSPLYHLFSSVKDNGGTFGTNQGVIREMLEDLGIKDSVKALFFNEAITDDNFLTDLGKLDITKEKLTQALNDLFWNPNRESVARLTSFIKDNEVIKLVQKNFPGMNGVEAIRFLYLAETKEAGNNGICNYATAVNMIFNKYIGKEALFEANFGYSMYITNSQGKKILNDSMLLVDMYSTINKGVLVKEVDGKYEIATTNDNYLNLADVGRFEMDYLQRFIDAKGIDLGLKENFYYSSYDGQTMWKEELILKIKESLENGEYINISGAGFDLLRKDGSIALKDCGGHIMTVVGLTTDGKVIVDSWGQELFIDLEKTLEHLGEKYGSDGYTRRLAIASYELIDSKTNVNIKSNYSSDPYIETFDIPKGIDMIDESIQLNNESRLEEHSTQTSINNPKNIKQLSIIDNIKHTLQRINDKFTGYKTSKLNTESYYDRTTKSNNKLFKQKQINKTFRDFANRHLIDLENLINNGLLRNPKISEINSLITNNRVLSNMEAANVSIADILGTKKNVDLDKNFGLLFDESASEFQTRDLGLLEYTSDQILGVLSESFKNHPLVISEVDTGKYIIEDNGYHRYSILRLHYLNEYIKVKDNPELVRELNEKYKVPVKVYKLDTTKTYSTSILKALGMNVEVRTKGFKKTSNIFIDGKKVIMSDTELIEFTKNMINSTTNSTQVINRLLSESESFKEFYNKYLVSESADYGIELDERFVTEGMQIKVNNKTYSLDTIIDILENRYLDILKGETIEGINSQNMFGIINKVFENNPLIETQYKSNYDNIKDIFKTKYVDENGNLYPKAFNFIKTGDIIEVLKNPYKIQKYSKEKQIQINEAIKMYIRYSFSSNYYLATKEYKMYKKISDLISRDVPNIKLTSEVKSSLLTEFRRNEVNGGTFGSKQGIIRSLLERNGITNAINYLFNKDAKGIKFLEQMQDFTDEDFQDLLDNAVDETGKLDGLYNLYEQIELFDLMRNNLDGIEDLEIIKFLYLFETTEAGARGICNYSVAVNMIFNKYLGKEAAFERDFGYPMYVVTKNGKKVLNDMMLLVDMYSIINKEVFTTEVDNMVKVVATSNENYLKVANIGGSFNMKNLNKFFDAKGIKLDLNQTFTFDSRTDVIWKDEIISNVKHALEKGETVNLSAAGFNLYRKDGTLAYEDFGAHAMTIVGITKDGNLIVDSHGREMIVNLDLTLENLSRDYTINGKPMTRRIGITTYSFDSNVPSSNQNMDIIDVSDNVVNEEFDEGIFDVFSKPSGDIDLFKDALFNNKLNTLSDSEIKSLIENINKGKIKPKDYVLSAETIRILIDKVPLKKIFPLSNVTAIKSFIDYFGVDTLIEFDRLNNGFLFGNKGENLYNLFDFYDLSIPKTNVVDKMKELNKLIVDTINSNKKTEHKTYTFIYSELIGTEFAKIHPELFLDESAPEDLKIAFYNGLVNSSNEYKPEWAPYLEGKSVKGVIHEALVSYSEIDAVENINIIGETSSKYNEGLEELATRTGMSVEEVQEILGIKLKELIDTSEFGVRRTLKSLEAILKSGKIKNQFEVNHTSYGVNSTDMRMAMEKDLFGIPRNMKYEDRPIYGMLLPGDLTSKYVQKGPGAYYSDGDGVIYIFNKDKIMKNTTLTLGDSIDQASKICATNLSNPKYFGMFSEMLSTIKTKEDLLSFDFRSLYEKKVMEVGNSAYYEFQLHGESSHTLDNLKEIVFLKMPEARIIKKLNEKNIKWRVLTKEGLITGAPEQKTTEVIVDVNDKSKYFSFSKDLDKSNNQLSVYFGDAGRDVNMLFLNGKTINQILDELQGTKKIDFQKFLNYTIQGQYLSRLTHEEIEALLLYTRYFFEDVNTMLREKNIYGSIDGKNAQALIDTIDSAIEKYNGLEQAMEVYRFVDINAFTHKGSAYKVLFDGIDLSDLNQVYSVLKVLEGKEISDLGYMSTSPKYVTSFSVSENYPIVLDIIAHKGTECAYINQISKYYNIENEILFARNTTLKIVEVLKPQEDTSGLKKIVIKCIVKEKE